MSSRYVRENIVGARPICALCVVAVVALWPCGLLVGVASTCFVQLMCDRSSSAWPVSGSRELRVFVWVVALGKCSETF